jgi:ketopantoate reductase
MIGELDGLGPDGMHGGRAGVDSSLAFPAMGIVAQIRTGEIPMPKQAGSMALDIARGVPTEIDELIGFIARQGERLNMPVPSWPRRLAVG